MSFFKYTSVLPVICLSLAAVGAVACTAPTGSVSAEAPSASASEFLSEARTTNNVVMIGESDNGTTVRVIEGNEVVVSLPVNVTAGYEWKVTSDDNSFGPAQITYKAAPGPHTIDVGMVENISWNTFPTWHGTLGLHRITLELHRSSDLTAPAEAKFSVLVDVQAGRAGVGSPCAGIAGIRCEAGLVCLTVGTYPDASGTCQRPVSP